jgi:hypothetical protein
MRSDAIVHIFRSFGRVWLVLWPVPLLAPGTFEKNLGETSTYLLATYLEDFSSHPGFCYFTLGIPE